MSPDYQRHAREGWPATAAATIGLAFGPSAILLFVFGVFVGPLQREFGWSRPAILFGVTIISLMIMVVSPIQGFLIDRFGARRLVLASSIPFGVGIYLFSRLSADITAFYLLCGVMPVLGIGFWPVSYLRVVSTWFDRRLGLAIGIANGGIGIGAAILPPAITYLVLQGEWRSAYVALALIVLLVTFPLNLWTLHEAPAERRASRTFALSPQIGMAFREVARTRSFVLLLVAFFLLGFINTGLLTNQVPLLIDGGLSPARAAFVQSVFAIAVIAGRFLTGVLLDRFAAPRLMTVVCLGGLAACLLYTSGVTGDLIFLSPVLLGAVFGSEFDVLSFLIKRFFGMLAFGRTYGVVFAVFQLGAALGVTVLPFSRSMTGSYTAGLLIYAAALAISAICFLGLGSRNAVVLKSAATGYPESG